ncbi:hypothetical protein MTO96_045099 [Rhipicephalus appendiculatus]
MHMRVPKSHRKNVFVRCKSTSEGGVARASVTPKLTRDNEPPAFFPKFHADAEERLVAIVEVIVDGAALIFVLACRHVGCAREPETFSYSAIEITCRVHPSHQDGRLLHSADSFPL